MSEIFKRIFFDLPLDVGQMLGFTLNNKVPSAENISEDFCYVQFFCHTFGCTSKNCKIESDADFSGRL